MVGEPSPREFPRRLKQILATYRKLKPESDPSSFKAQTRAEISAMVRDGSLSAADSERLLSMRDMVVKWRASSAFSLVDAFEEWVERHRSAPDDWERKALRDLVGCLPKGALPQTAWWPIVAGQDSALREAVLGGGLVRSADLVKIAKTDPDGFVRSPGMEALLEMGSAIPRILWEKAALEAARPNEASFVEEAVSASYGLDEGNDSSTWLIRFLDSRPILRFGVVRQLMRDPATLLKLVRGCAGHAVGVDGRRPKPEAERVDAILGDIVTACTGAVERKRPAAESAERVLYLIRQLVASDIGNYGPELRSSVDSSTAPIIEDRLAEFLRRAHLSTDPMRDPELSRHVLSARPHEIARACDLFMGGLVDGTRGDSADRETALARFRAVRNLVEDILPLVELPAGADVNGSLRTALFNAGVRPVESVDARVDFNPVRHESRATDPSVGDTVRIVTSGWQLGESATAMILQKACAELDECGEGGEK